MCGSHLTDNVERAHARANMTVDSVIGVYMFLGICVILRKHVFAHLKRLRENHSRCATCPLDGTHDPI